MAVLPTPDVARFVRMKNGMRHAYHRLTGCPDYNSDEWIEYIPPPCVVERDGDLWWRYYAADIDSMRYIQLTKGSSCALPSTPTGSR